MQKNLLWLLLLAPVLSAGTITWNTPLPTTSFGGNYAGPWSVNFETSGTFTLDVASYVELAVTTSFGATGSNCVPFACESNPPDMNGGYSGYEAVVGIDNYPFLEQFFGGSFSSPFGCSLDGCEAYGGDDSDPATSSALLPAGTYNVLLQGQYFNSAFGDWSGGVYVDSSITDPAPPLYVASSPEPAYAGLMLGIISLLFVRRRSTF